MAKWSLKKLLGYTPCLDNDVLKIHGSKDRLLPLKSTLVDFNIPNAGHLMIFENASEVSEVLNEINQRLL